MNRLFVALLFGLLLAGQALAGDFERAARETSHDLQQARQELAAAREETARAERELGKKLADLKTRLRQERELQASLQKQLSQASQDKARAAQRLKEVSGDLRELAGHVAAAARELLGLAQTSPVTAELPGRVPALQGMLAKGRLPGLADIESLIALYRQEIRAASSIGRRQGPMVDLKGNQSQAQICRVGPFATVYRQKEQVGFLLPGPNPARLLAVGGELPWGIESRLADFWQGKGAALPLDISGGAALRGLARRPSLAERFESGGPLVWPILAVGLVALVLFLERLVFLRRVRFNTDDLMVKVTELVSRGQMEQAQETALARKGRPVANVILAGLKLAGKPPEAMEAGLGEAMLREMPRLERSLTTLKVLAAVAPLLGLLGTVTGMINTFQVITVHGSGDPRLMAGGISEALVTTQLGLAVAIPILVASTLLGRRAQRLAGDMEEKALGFSAALIYRDQAS